MLRLGVSADDLQDLARFVRYSTVIDVAHVMACRDGNDESPWYDLEVDIYDEVLDALHDIQE